MCEDTSPPMEEFVHSANLQILGQEKGEGNGSVSRCGNLLLKYKEVLLTEYQLEIKQIVEYPRCRVPQLREIIMKKVSTVLSAQGFPCFGCRKFTYRLTQISDMDERPTRYVLTLLCGSNEVRTAVFELCFRPVKKR